MSDFKGASGGRDGIDKGLFLGYTPGGSQKFSWSIEGYINDAGIANMAKELGDMDAYTYYKSRATNYVNLFRDGDGVENKWLAAKNADGSWTRSKVDPFAFHDDYTETTALNMACSVPQDGQGLANLYGGRAALAEKLDQLFETTLETDTVGANQGIHERREAQEVKMGEYGHSNQPSHHIPYMYLYASRPDRTQEKVRQVLRQCYVGSRIGQGYIGDEDNGEMSAWFIFSAMGLYPLNMGSGELVFGSPLFKKITLHHENGHDLIIEAPNNSSTNIYVGGLTINGTPYSKTSIKQTDLTDRLENENVVLRFDMQATPGDWGTGENDVPDSLTKGDETPDPLRDRTNSAAVVAEEVPTTLSSGDSIYCADGENLKNLLDNNSKTSATLKPTDGIISLYYTFAKPQAVSLYTLTSASGGKDSAPKNFTLYLSNDGSTWTEADKRENVTFEWSLYTKPFKTNAADYVQYRYVRLDIKSDSEIQLGELELMSTEMPALNADALNGMIAEAMKAKKALSDAGYAPLETLMSAAIGEAQTVADKEDKTDDEIEEACRKLINAMSEIEGMKDLWTKLDAIRKVDTSKMPSAVQNSVRSAISNAEEVTKNYNSTMDALKDAKSQLEQASNDIQSYQDLVAKIEEAQQVYEGLADDAAHKDDLNQAIQNAQTALNDPNATTGDFNHANDALDLNIKLAQAKFRNAYKNIEAEEFTKFETDAHDSRIVNDGNNIGGVASGTWVKYSNVYFSGNGAKKVTFFYAAQQRDAGGGQIHIRLGSLDGKEIATLTCPATGSNWSNYVELSGELTEITKGMHDVYLYFENNTGKTYVANVDWFRFTESSSHQHIWSSEWTHNETHHWHECTAEGCTVTDNADKDGYAEHVWDEGTVTKPATETEKGQKTFTCVCGATKTEEIPELGHTHHLTKHEAMPATEEAPGNKAYYTCDCGKWFWDEGGLEEIENHNDVIIPQLGHTHHLTKHEATPATEEAPGNKAYYTCDCGKWFWDEGGLEEIKNHDDITIPKLTPVPTPIIPVTPSEPAKLPFNPNAGSNVSKFPFADVPSDSWYYSSVKAAWENNLIDGVTANEFKPNATLTVAQTIKLAAALHQLDRTGEVSLKNSGANWYDSYVNYAVVNGIIEKDYANYTKAQMNAPVTRGEFVHIFHGAEEAYKAINTVADNAIPDVKTTDKFAAEIYEFYRAGILTGSDAKGTFHSASTIKRSEAAAILLRMFEAAARVSIDLP